MAGEAKFEKRLIDHAAKFGWWTKKLVAADRTGDPDRLFLRKGRVVFLELKDKDERPERKQLRRMDDIRKHGGDVHWTDNFEAACDILDIPHRC